MEGARRGMTTERTGAISDGIFAIAATLLVLEIHALIPPPRSCGGPWRRSGQRTSPT